METLAAVADTTLPTTVRPVVVPSPPNRVESPRPATTAYCMRVVSMW